MSITRAPCPNCQLPYYTDRNDACPYCGATAGDEAAADESAGAEPSEMAAGMTGSDSAETIPAGSVRRSTPPSRPRETCQECGLPYYADDVDGCPYCDTAGVETPGATADSGPTAHGSGATEPTASAGAGGSESDRGAGTSSRSGGLVSRILGLLGR